MFRLEDYIVMSSAINSATVQSDIDDLKTLRGRIVGYIVKDYGENVRLMEYLEGQVELYKTPQVVEPEPEESQKIEPEVEDT